MNGVSSHPLRCAGRHRTQRGAIHATGPAVVAGGGGEVLLHVRGREFVDLSETFPGPFLGTTRSRRGSSWRRCESSTVLCQSSLLPTAATPWPLDSAGRCCWTCPLLAAETTCGLQRRLAGRRCGAGLGGSGWPWTEQRGRGSATLRTRAALSAGAAWRGRGGDLAEIAPRLRRDCVLAELWPRSGEG